MVDELGDELVYIVLEVTEYGVEGDVGVETVVERLAVGEPVESTEDAIRQASQQWQVMGTVGAFE